MILQDFVYSKNYWDEAANTDPFARILSKYNQEKFWATQPKIQGLTKDMIFLDFGCGIGRIVRTVAPLVKEYWGVDASKGMIEKAKDYHVDYDNVQFFVNNGSDLSIFKDNTFDFVYSCLVFIHVSKEDIRKYVREIHRVLKSGGIYHSQNFPRQKMYANGFLLSEVQKLFRIFEKVVIQRSGAWYHLIRSQK